MNHYPFCVLVHRGSSDFQPAAVPADGVVRLEGIVTCEYGEDDRGHVEIDNMDMEGGLPVGPPHLKGPWQGVSRAW